MIAKHILCLCYFLCEFSQSMGYFAILRALLYLHAIDIFCDKVQARCTTRGSSYSLGRAAPGYDSAGTSPLCKALTITEFTPAADLVAHPVGECSPTVDRFRSILGLTKGVVMY